VTEAGEKERPDGESIPDSSKPRRLPWRRSGAHPGLSPNRAALDALFQDMASPQAAVRELLGERQLWWRCCSEAFRNDPSWLFDGRGEQRCAWLGATVPNHATDSVTPTEHAWLLGRALSAPEDQTDERDETLEQLAEVWRRSGLISADAAGPAQPSGHGLDGLSPRTASGLRAVVDRLRDLGSPAESNGPASVLVIAALLMAGAEARPRPVVRVSVVFGRSGGPTGESVPKVGVTGILELREFRSGPPGLYPDARTMAGVLSPSAQFAASLGRAWAAAGPRREGRCVLWRIVLSDEPVPPARIEGPSLGAAFALGLRDLLRRPLSHRPSVAGIRNVVYGLRPRTAVTGDLDADGRLLRVAGMDAKLLAARRKGLRLVAPEANRLDVATAPEPGDVRFAANLSQADRYARRLRTGRLAVAALVLIAIATGAYALQQQVSARSEQQAGLASRIAAEANQLRSTDPSLAAQLDLAAYRITPTPDLYSHLIADANAPLSTVLNDYTGSVHSVAFSPDDHTLAAAGYEDGDNGTVRLWNMADPAHAVLLGEPIQGLGNVGSVAFSPDGHILAASGFNTVRFWNVTNPAHPVALGQPLRGTGIGDVGFSSDGRTLVTGGNSVTEELLWNVTDPAHPVPLGQPLKHETAVNAVALSPAGHILATADASTTVQLWNVADPAHTIPLGQIPTGQTGGISSMVFSPDGSILATGGHDDAVRLWNTADPAHPVLLAGPITGHTSYVSSMVFNPDGRTLATASADHTVRLWNVTDPAHPTHLAHPLIGHTGGVYSVAYSPDGHTLATTGDDHTVRLWNLQAVPVTGHAGVVDLTVFSRDRHTLATASADNTVRLWNVTDPKHPNQLGQIQGFTQAVGSMALSPDGRTLATAVYSEKRVLLWDVSHPARPIVLVQLVKFGSGVSSVAFSPDGRTLATDTSTGIVGGDKSVQLWNVTDPAHPVPVGRPFTGNDSVVTKVAFSPDGRTLAVSGTYANGGVRLWDVTDPAHATDLGRPLPGGVSSMVFSPDGRTLATITYTGIAGAPGDGTVRLWDVSDRTHPVPLGPPLSGYTSPVKAVAFSPDGQTLATAGTDVRLWNVTDPAHPAPVGQPLDVSVEKVSAIAFVPDDHTLATGSYDNTVRLWQLAADQAIRQICASTNVPTRQQWQQYLSELPYRSSCG
jgi:WD40 repeat protein